MTFVHDNGDERATPPTEGTLHDGRTVSGIQPDDLALLAECGWHPVTPTPRPDDTDTTTHDRTVTEIDGTWTVTWTKRDRTADEMAPPEPDRVAVLEAQNAALLADLAKVTTVAAVRAAAAKASDLG